MKIAGPQVVFGKPRAQIVQAHGHDVNHFPLALDVAVGLDHGGAAGGGAEQVVDVGADDDVDDAGFVFEGGEDDALGRAGALANDDQACDLDPASGPFVPHVGGGGDLSLVQLVTE